MTAPPLLITPTACNVCPFRLTGRDEYTQDICNAAGEQIGMFYEYTTGFEPKFPGFCPLKRAPLIVQHPSTVKVEQHMPSE